MDGQEKPKLPYYRQSAEDVVKELRSSDTGLATPEATERLAQFGGNSLRITHTEPWLLTYLRQFRDLMIVLLLASSVISFYLRDPRTALVLLALVLFNTTIGFLQEHKAERLIESLEKLVVTKARVERGGQLLEVASEELVVGDVVHIEAGDSIPADLRILSEAELATNDFALTGESNPTRKYVHAVSGELTLAQRHNLLFMGTTVATGQGRGIVIATGMHTELGRIASLSQDTGHSVSPLQKEMNHIATLVTKGTVALCVILLPIAIHAGLSGRSAFLFAIGIASSIIPQGLPAEINTALAQAAAKLARARALVKKLSAVETLGATNLIATDKTGTLTKNEMTAEHLLIGKTEYGVTGSGYETNGVVTDSKGKPLSGKALKELHLFFETGALASNAEVNPPDPEHATWYVVGDPTEGALITLARKAGLEPRDLNQRFPERKEYQFDSARKRMTSVREIDGQLYAFVKGAPESVLEQATDLWDHGHVRRLTARDRQAFLAYNEAHAAQAQRNLAFAYRVLPKGFDPRKHHLEDAEQKLTMLGIVSMIDPLREEVPAAMVAARQAHIKVAIVTGDYAVTAQAIAKRAHLAENPADITVVSGEELPDLDDTQVLGLLRRGGVIFSRVAPEDKLRIVRIAQAANQVVAVTGDGINDAPALKKADIGVAMGLTGTDVAKQSAEIVLLDDSFHTLVGAVQQGRTIFQNIKKGTLSCFTSNAAELVVNLVSLAALTFFQVPIALSVMEILAIDLVAELFPIAALGWDRAEGELMSERPRSLNDHILNRQSIFDLAWCGILIGGFAFLNFLLYFWRRGLSAEHISMGSHIQMQATALTYLTIVLCQLANIMQRRSVRGLFTRYQFHNRQLWFALGISLFCVLNIIYNPWVAPYFQAGPLGVIDWLLALAAVALFVAAREFQRSQRQHSRRALFARHGHEKIRRHLQPAES